MWKFHRLSFEEILNNIFEQMDEYDAGFTFPTIASVTPFHPDRIKSILHEGHEIANHGYKHVRYEHLSDAMQLQEFEKSMHIFDSLNIPIHGFRAPYNNYNKRTIQLVEEFGFNWDGGIGYKPEYRETNEPFKYNLDGKSTSFWSIPLHRYSDDHLIDRYGLNSQEMTRAILPIIQQMPKKGSVLMLDLHPIRIGQPNYSEVLGNLLQEAQSQGAWTPTVNEAVLYWEKHRKWPKNASFCFLITGDIDNFIFFDYLRRLT
jgi:peptidoglycan/xylan/chitin deacetylase (PgdA/CDA1 family)